VARERAAAGRAAERERTVKREADYWAIQVPTPSQPFRTGVGGPTVPHGPTCPKREPLEHTISTQQERCTSTPDEAVREAV
jgi:hypothetical protein